MCQVLWLIALWMVNLTNVLPILIIGSVTKSIFAIETILRIATPRRQRRTIFALVLV